MCGLPSLRVRPHIVQSRRANVVNTTTDESKKLQSETVAKLRSLSHDLSNYIETIMQASYLLAQAKLDDNNKKWLEMVDKASQDAARINREIREILRANS
jgi:K+-sensing histidine kinase KdpD